MATGEVIDMNGETERVAGLRRITLIDYCLHLASPILSMGFLTVIALIMNYLKRGDAAGTIYASHMNWMIRTTWWTLFWIIVLAIPFSLLTVLTFGILAWLFALPIIWYLYRMIRGVLRLNEGQPMPE